MLVSTEKLGLGFEVRKNLGVSSACGFARAGHARCGSPSEFAGIYQIRHNKNTQQTVRMRYYRPTNPQTVPQEANRSKFAAAMAAWQSLTDGQKAVYNKRAKRLSLYGRNLYIREYYQTNP